MIKKLAVLAVLTGSAFTLTGCDFTTEDIKSAIEQCKADEECAALINNEIDEALEDRGIYPNDDRDFHHDSGYELPELTEEEQALLDTFEALEDEFYTVLENMTEEEYFALEIKNMESILGRELTTDELAAYELIESLYSSLELAEYVDPYEEYETEQEFIEAVLERDLTQEELDALAVMDEMFQNHRHHEELTAEQEAALNIVDALYEEVHDAMIIVELETALGRELSAEELAALALIEDVEEEYWNNLADFDFDNYDVVQEQINTYETVLGRTLTEDEVAAIEFIYTNNFFFPFEDFEDCYEVEIEESPTV